MVPALTVIDVYDEILAFRLGFPLPHYLRNAASQPHDTEIFERLHSDPRMSESAGFRQVPRPLTRRG